MTNKPNKPSKPSKPIDLDDNDLVYNPQKPVDQIDRLMDQAARELGRHVLLRFDPLRTDNLWTVVIDGIRLCDTNQPVTRFLEYVKREKLDQQKSKKKEQNNDR